MGSFPETYPLRPGSNLRSGVFFSVPLVSKTKREERPPDRRLAWFRPRWDHCVVFFILTVLHST